MSSGSYKNRQQRLGGWEKSEENSRQLNELDMVKMELAQKDTQMMELKRTFPSQGSLKKKVRQLVNDTHHARYELQRSMIEVSNLTVELQDVKNQRTPISTGESAEVEKLNSEKEEFKLKIEQLKRAQTQESENDIIAASPDRNGTISSADAASRGEALSYSAPGNADASGGLPTGTQITDKNAVGSTSHPGTSSPTNLDLTPTGKNGLLASKFGKKNEDARAFMGGSPTSGISSNMLPNVQPHMLPNSTPSLPSVPASSGPSAATMAATSAAMAVNPIITEESSHDLEVLTSPSNAPETSSQTKILPEDGKTHERVWSSLTNHEVKEGIKATNTKILYRSIDECAASLLPKVQKILAQNRFAQEHAAQQIQYQHTEILAPDAHAMPTQFANQGYVPMNNLSGLNFFPIQSHMFQQPTYQ